MRDLSWNAALDAEQFAEEYVANRARIADAAKEGNFTAVLRGLDQPWSAASDWRLEGTSWFTPLHQAAWHGAPITVAEELLWRGAFRSQPDARGRLPADIAQTRGHDELAVFLTPHPHPCDKAHLRSIERHLHDLVMQRAAEMGVHRQRLRAVPVAILIELRPDERLYVPVPGMYGGFSLRWEGEAVEASSWSRVAGGSGQTHIIRPSGAELTEEGFV